MKTNTLKQIIYAVALPLILLLIWWFSSSGSTNAYFPSLERIVTSFIPTWFEGGAKSRIVEDGFPSLYRFLAGFAAAVILGIILGLFIGMSEKLRAFLEPALEIMRAIPAPVLVPIISLFLGIGDAMKIVVIVAGALWPILLNVIEGVRSVDPVVLETAKTYRLKKFTFIRHVIFPAALPQTFAGIRQGLAVSIILMVISEMFASSNGIGFSVVQFQRNFAIPQMWTGIFVLGIFGVLASLIFQMVEKNQLRWYHGLKASEIA